MPLAFKARLAPCVVVPRKKASTLLLALSLKIEKQDFAETTKGFIILDWHFDGVFGMAYDVAAVNGMNPPFYHMIGQHPVDEPVFAFYFGNASNGEGGQGGWNWSTLTKIITRRTV